MALVVGLVLVTGFRLAGAAPVQMFFVLAVIGVLHLLVMYAVTNLAAVAHLRRTGAGRPGLLLPPLVGAVVAVAVLVQSALTARLPLPLAVAGWLALGAVFALLPGRPPVTAYAGAVARPTVR